MPHILHINDNNLLLQNTLEQGGDILLRSQGYAWLNGDSVVFDVNHDERPVDHCRLAPQQINNRYWQQCAQNAIASNGAGMRHAADLIWKHLSELKTKFDLTELALVVPANYRDTHLQLLLGVAKAAGLTVSALINKPVLTAVEHGVLVGDAVHIDVQLHQTVLSVLAVSDADVSLKSVDTKAELGIHSVQESLLHALQASFIRADRFDPLHDASTEQQLFTQLPAIVNSAVNGEKATVGVQHQSRLYSTVIDPSEVEGALGDLVSLIQHTVQQTAQPDTQLTTLIDVNGAFDLASLSSLDYVQARWAADPGAIPQQLADGRNEHGNVVYQTQLPHRAAHAGDALTREKQTNFGASSRDETSLVHPSTLMVSQTKQTESGVPATHLMQYGVAVPLERAVISTDNATLSLLDSVPGDDLAGLLKTGRLHVINDTRRQTLQANDRLMSPLADGVITAINVT